MVHVQCVAMNRSLTNVLFGGIAPIAQTNQEIKGQVTKTTVEETVDALASAENVIIVSFLFSTPLSGCTPLRNIELATRMCQVRRHWSDQGQRSRHWTMPSPCFSPNIFDIALLGS